MSKATWGVIGAGVAVVVAAVFVVSKEFWFLTGDTATQTTGEREVSESTVRAEATAQEPAASLESQAGSDAALQEEAESYVEQLAEPSDEPIQMGSAEQFVAPDQRVSPQPGGADERDEPGRKSGVDGALEADAPPSELPEVTAEEAGTMESDGGGAGAASPPEPTVDLPLSEEVPVTIAELIGAGETIPSDAVLYVHTVRPADNQGIWGIVHHGILENFAEGVAVHRGESSEIYQVDIPRHADERRADNSSSFLGRLIHERTRQSYVYNYRTDRVGRNPDLIRPGEEIVIVSFTPDELVSVYKHFVTGEARGSRN